jgi:CPA2 family monovalent cation:H+ antiporter-2
MHTPQLFSDLLIVLLVSVPVAFVCLRLKLPLVVGLMLTGIVIGPYGFGLVAEVEAIEILAEIGVMLLLFTIGLEFSLSRLREMRSLVLVGGGLQVILTTAVVAVVSILLGRSQSQAIFFGFLVALSSTAIVLKSYVDRKEVDAPHGRVGVGILLFQDISIVFMMLVVPVLGGSGESSIASVALQLGGSLLALLLIVSGSWLLLPRFLKQIVNLQSPEVFLLTVVLVCLGLSWVTSHFGLSLALGGFIAGMVIAETDYKLQVIAEVMPFRDVFNSIFFVSIGMLLSVSALFENLTNVILLVIGLTLLKALIVWGVVRLMGYPQRISVVAALGLAQIGEFSFILAKVGRSVDLLPDGDYQNFLAASIISMIATPFLIAVAPRLGFFVQKKLSDGFHEEDSVEAIHDTQTTQGLADHVIIVGYGLNGRNLARVLRAVGIEYVVLDLSAQVIARAKIEGERITFGDATRREVLQHVNIAEAKTLVLAMSDAGAARRTVSQAREMNKDLYIIVRTRYAAEITELIELGADEVIPEEFETSIEIFARVLHRMKIPRSVIEEQIERIRKQGYQMLRSTSLPQVVMGNLNAALHDAATETLKLGDDSAAVGKSLGELDLRGRTGATVIAVIHDGETRVSPGAHYKLSAGDTVLLSGSGDKIERASEILKGDGTFGGFNP